MEKVRAGETVAIKAATWNSFVDAAEFAKSAKRLVGASAISSGLGGGMVFVRNTGSETLPRFGAVVLGEPVLSHSASDDEFGNEVPAFDGVAAEEETEDGEKDMRPFAVTVEPIANGEIGRAVVCGVTPAKVEIRDEDDKCAEPVPGSTTGALRSANTGYARIAWKEDGTGEKWCFLRLGASEPRTDGKSLNFALRDPEGDDPEDEDAARTENIEINGFSSKDAEEETLGERLSRKDDATPTSASGEGGEETSEDEVMVRSGDRKKVKFMKIGRGASSVEVDEVSIDFALENPSGGDDDDDDGSSASSSGEKSNKVQVFGFDSQDADGTSLADHLAEQESECEDEVVVRSADRAALKYVKIGHKLATMLEAGENIAIEQNGNTITISAEVDEPDEFVTSGYSTKEGSVDVEIADIRYYEHNLQIRKATKVYENGLLKSRTLGDWETFTTAVEETV